MNKKNPEIKLSVVIPAYNEEKQLPACLKSLSRQKIDASYEIIVVDNNSTDNTDKIAKKYGARILYEKQKGVSFARQLGAQKAKGEIIVSTDADSIYPSDWLSNIYHQFQKSNTIAVLGPFEYEDKPKWGKWYSQLLFKAVGLIYTKTGKIIYPPASNFAYRKITLMEIGGYNTALTQGGDEHDFYKRLLKYGRIIYLPQNKITTSSRRLNKGVFYSLFVTLIIYYILNYYIGSKITGKTVFGQWPAYREPKKPFQISWVFDLVYFTLCLVLFLSFILGTGKVYSKNRVLTGSHKVMSASKDGLIDVNEQRKNLESRWHDYSQNHHLKEIN